MATVASKAGPLLLLLLLFVVFLYVTQPAPLPAPIVFPDHNFDPTVIGPLLAP